MTAGAAPLNERVAAAVNDTIQVATAHGAVDLVARLQAEAELWKERETTVVVAGEPNRGKSSLLNAVLDRPVLPAGTGRTTTAYVVLRHGEPGAAVHLEGRREPTAVALDEVATWAASEPGAGVRAIVATLDHPLLATGLTLVDTPGVGGLDEAHGRITLAALGRADALLFVLDAGAPLSKPELEFLERATDRIDRVVFVITKVDQFRGWRAIADDDRALLEQHAPRFANAPIVPVSARLKALADARGPGADDGLVAESGIPGLVGVLGSTIVGHTALLRLANLLRLALAGIATLTEPVRTAIAASEGEPGAKAAIERDQQRLDELRDRSERLQVRIADRFGALRESLNAELNRALRDVAARHGSANASASGDELVAAVEADLRAADAGLEELIDREVAALVAEVSDTFDDEGFALAFGREGGGHDLDLAALVGGADAALEPDPMMRMRVATAVASSGTGLAMFGRYAASGDVIAWFVGAGVALGLASAAMNLRMARKQRDATAVRRQLQQTIEAAREEVGPRLRQELLVVQRDIEADLRGYVRQRTRDLQAAVADSTQLARADAAARQKRRAEAERDLAALEARRAALEALHDEVSRVTVAARRTAG